jgi:peroxin-14
LISPPTPSQLALDKAAVDESFSRAFALIDQLATDTAYLKSAETERTEKLDVTLRDVESVIADLKTANSTRETESRILAGQVLGLRDLVPKALDGWKAAEDKRLEDLGADLRSLKLLVANRFGVGAGSQASSSRSYPSSTVKERSDVVGTGDSASVANTSEDSQSAPAASGTPDSGTTAPKQEIIGRYQSGGKVAIPLWQMPASAGKGKAVSDPSKGEDEKGTDAEA